MKRVKQAICAVAMLSLIVGCATKPESVAPAYVSHLGYMNLDCQQLGHEQNRIVSALSAAADAQRKARSNDTVGIILLGLPVSSLSGSNQASNIARLKGELDAIQKALIEKKCDVEIVSIDEVIAKNEDG